MPIKLEVPKDFKDKKELNRIVTMANVLNAILEKACVFRAHKSRPTKKIRSIKKKWLQLDFVEVHRGVMKHPPPPTTIHITAPEKVKCECSKCHYKFEATYEQFFSMRCPKCNAFEIAIVGYEDEKEEGD